MDRPYCEDRLSLYFERIRLPVCKHPKDPLRLLNLLIQHQLAEVPFETLSLHYSVDGRVSLQNDDLFDKIVVRKRGGYCLELNTFFATVLTSMGYQVVGIICRIAMAVDGEYDGSWRPM